MKKIKITLMPDGTQKVEVFNSVGTECGEFTRALEDRLGVQVGERVLKPEYYETVHETEFEHEVDR